MRVHGTPEASGTAAKGRGEEQRGAAGTQHSHALTAAEVPSSWWAQGQQSHPHLNLHFGKLNALHYQHGSFCHPPHVRNDLMFSPR